MDLVNAAYDGDIKSLNCALDANVPVDIVTPVRNSSSCFRTESRCFYVSPQNGRSSLMAASQNGHVEVVHKLLKRGARVDLQNKVNTSCDVIK